MLPEELYVELYPLLRQVAEQKFGVPEDIAEDIVQEVFTSFLSKPVPIEHARGYVVAAVSNRCRTYWREEARFDRDAAIPERQRVPHYHRVMAVRRTLGKLPRLERSILLLRARGWRVAEIAARIGYSVSWTEKLLRRAREAAVEELDLTHRFPKGRRTPRTDNYVTVGCGYATYAARTSRSEAYAARTSRGAAGVRAVASRRYASAVAA